MNVRNVRAEAITHKSIAGGFVRIDVAELMHAWTRCNEGEPGAGGLRTWLACREMVARRRGVAGGRSPVFGVTELARLTGTTTRTAATSLRSLVVAGLLTWSEDAIGFPHQVGDVEEMVADSIGRGQGEVSIPRRMLRHLARGAKPALIATVLATLLRCVSRRRAGFTSRGRLAASWVARAFRVDIRRVKQARGELVKLGWLAAQPSDAWATNRWGSAWTVDLAWRRPRTICHPDRPDSGARLPPPDLHPDPLREESNPDPAGRGPAGASLLETGTDGLSEDRKPPTSSSTAPGLPHVQAEASATTSPVEERRTVAVAKPIPKPNLCDVRPEDLTDISRTLQLYDQAVAMGRITASEADRIRFIAAVEHARAVGKENPPGLLARIVSKGWWYLLTHGDEDRASRRLGEHGRSAGRPAAARPSCLAGPPTLAPGPPPAAASMPRSPYGSERPMREPSALGDLLARMAIVL